jgi:hypothetical protein
MFKDLHWIIILFIFALIIFYSNKNKPLIENYKNSIVKIGGGEIQAAHFFNSDEFPFGLLSTYEIGRVYNPGTKKGNYSDTYYGGYYRNN